MFCGCKSVQLVAVFYLDLASCLECRNGRSRGEQDGAPAAPWCRTTPPKWSMFYVPSPWQPVPDLIHHRFGWATPKITLLIILNLGITGILNICAKERLTLGFNRSKMPNEFWQSSHFAHWNSDFLRKEKWEPCQPPAEPWRASTWAWELPKSVADSER